MPTAEKVAKVNELTQKMAGSKAIFLADFTGLDVAAVTNLRTQLRNASVEYEVVKNRLAKRALPALTLRTNARPWTARRRHLTRLPCSQRAESGLDQQPLLPPTVC